MDAPALLRRTTLGLLASALGLAVTVYAARADEVAANARPSTLTIHDADEVLRDFCHSQDGVLWLTLPGGANFELITSTADPAITNPGDGRVVNFYQAYLGNGLVTEIQRHDDRRSAIAALSP